METQTHAHDTDPVGHLLLPHQRCASIALTFASGRKSISSRQTETTAELIGWSRGRQSSRPGRVLTPAWIGAWGHGEFRCS